MPPPPQQNWLTLFQIFFSGGYFFPPEKQPKINPAPLHTISNPLSSEKKVLTFPRKLESIKIYRGNYIFCTNFTIPTFYSIFCYSLLCSPLYICVFVTDSPLFVSPRESKWSDVYFGRFSYVRVHRQKLRENIMCAKEMLNIIGTSVIINSQCFWWISNKMVLLVLLARNVLYLAHNSIYRMHTQSGNIFAFRNKNFSKS